MAKHPAHTRQRQSGERAIRAEWQVNPNSTEYDMVLDQAVEFMVWAGITPDETDDLGEDITDTTAAALMIALGRSEKLRHFMEVTMQRHRTLAGPEKTDWHNDRIGDFAVTLSDRDEARRR